MQMSLIFSGEKQKVMSEAPGSYFIKRHVINKAKK